MDSTASRCVALLGAAVLLTATSARAQQAPPPVFRSGISVVEVTVIVRERDGAFVRGLTIDDFELVESGKPRKIELMYLVRAPERTGTAPVSSARPAPGSREAARTFVFAFDLAQMSPRSFTGARAAALKFARERLQPSDASGLAILGASSSGRISSVHTELIAGLDALKGRSDLAARDRPLREWPRILSFQEAADVARDIESTMERVRDRACQERDGSCNSIGGPEVVEAELRAKARQYIAESRVAASRSVAALESLVHALEAIKGRKTVVWFTEGTPVLEVAEQARRAAARASEAGVAVYAIDPRGLQSRTADVLETGVEEMGLEVLKDTGDLPAMLASGTGAMFIRNENRLDRALATIEDDTSSYYVIGYAAGDADNPSRNRRLSVRVVRPGLSARVRTGFMAPQRVASTRGSMVASPLDALPGTASTLSAPASAPTKPTPPPSAPTTEAAKGNAPTTASNVLRLRGASEPSRGSSADLASRGWRAYEKGDLEAALPLLEKAASMPDARPWGLYVLGFTYVGLGRPREAVGVWERVRAAAPDFTPVYLDLAAHYGQMSDVTKALAVLRDASTRWPGDHDFHNGIGVLLVRRGALSDAIAAFTKATEAAPDDALSWLNLGRTYELRYDRARRYDAQLLKWVGPESDRVKARASYERCVRLGGPYAEQAAEALVRMAWSE